jgi:hypothetical protein
MSEINKDVFLKHTENTEIHEKIDTINEQEDEYRTSQFKMLRLINNALSQKVSRYDKCDSDDDECAYDDDNMSLISYDSIEFSFDENE